MSGLQDIVIKNMLVENNKYDNNMIYSYMYAKTRAIISLVFQVVNKAPAAYCAYLLFAHPLYSTNKLISVIPLKFSVKKIFTNKRTLSAG